MNQLMAAAQIGRRSLRHLHTYSIRAKRFS